MVNNTHNNFNTYREIFNQPSLWREVYNNLLDEENAIDAFLEPILDTPGLRIVLTGAGSSAFIGEAAQTIIQASTGKLCQPIATTDLVTHAKSLMLKDCPTLVVSFARSGNSPESVEAVRLVNKYVADVKHLVITCNDEGALAKYCRKNPQNTYCVVLPEDANDKALAMTGSFTSMLLSSILIFGESPIQDYELQFQKMLKHADSLLSKAEKLREIAETPFQRAIFLGSGPLLGIARECHLKLQELTDGQVICKFDSFLGFRHGPRAVADENSIIVYLHSNDCHANKYEHDLIENISADVRNIPAILITTDKIIELTHPHQLDNLNHGNNSLYIVPFTLIGQLLGYFKALHYGLNPDNPSRTGAISRVVQGVKIYEES